MKKTIRLSESELIKLLSKIVKENQIIMELGDIDISNVSKLRDMINSMKEEYTKLYGMMEYYKKKGKTEEAEKIKQRIKDLQNKEDRMRDMIDDIWKKDKK